jgi:mRNA deadenylase 3'-5' endonuclease subunit Ccr4
MLADGLSALDKENPDYLRIPMDILKWEYRKDLILNEIVQYAPDIITLQENDHFFDFFLPEMSRRGYTGFFCPKPVSSCLEVSTRADGCTVFINKSTLSCISSYSITYAIDETNTNPEEDYYSPNKLRTGGRLIPRYSFYVCHRSFIEI